MSPINKIFNFERLSFPFVVPFPFRELRRAAKIRAETLWRNSTPKRSTFPFSANEERSTSPCVLGPEPHLNRWAPCACFKAFPHRQAGSERAQGQDDAGTLGSSVGSYRLSQRHLRRRPSPEIL